MRYTNGEFWRTALHCGAKGWVARAAAIALVAAMAGCRGTTGVRGIPGHVYDEAHIANRGPETFHAADEDYFHDMDGGPALSAEEVKGRNTWIVWTAGNDRMWDFL